MLRLLFIISSFFLLTGSRSPDEIRELLSDREKVNAAVFVDPEQLSADLLGALPIEDPKLFLNAMFHLTGIVGGPNDAVVEKLLPQAQKLADAYDDFDVQVGLKIRAARVSGSNAALEKVYRDAIEEAKHRGAIEALGRFQVELANRLVEWGDIVTALKLVEDANLLGRKPPIKDRVLAISIKIQAMMIYLDLDMQKEAIQVLKELVVDCHERGFSYMEGALLHNLGQAQLDVPEAMQEAEQNLLKGLRIADSLQNAYLATNFRVELAELLHKQHRLPDALNLILQAAREFAGLENPLREASAYKHAALYAAEMKSWDKALEYGTRAEKYFAQGFPSDNERVQKVLYEAHKALGHGGEALRHLELWVEQKAATDKKKEEQDYHKLAVKFGLDAEREKTLRLEREKADEHQRRILANTLLGLALGLLGLAMAAFYQSRRVAASRQRYQEVMEAIDEGILRFDHSLLIQAGHSPYLTKLLDIEEDPVGLSFLDILGRKNLLDQGSLDLLRSSLNASFGEEPLVWQMNEAHFPHQILAGGRTLAIHWTPAFQRDQLHHVLVTLRDRTEQQRLERHLAEEKARLDEVPEKLGEIFKAGLGQSLGIFQAAQGIVDTSAESSTLDWKRRLHTIKGNARTLGLRNFAGHLHQLEDARPYALQNLQTELRSYQKLLQELTLEGATPPASLAAIVGLMLPDFRARMVKAGLAFDQICLRDGVLNWPQEHLEWLRSILSHGLQNALDHGYLRPASRGWKASPFFCEVRALRRFHQLILEISDAGAGIDFAALRQRTRLPQASQAVLIEQLFEDGISTAETITDTSGRGIGLAAIRALCEERGGTVTLQPGTDQRGVTLLVEMPRFFTD